MNHLLRTVTPGSADSQLARFDAGVRYSLGIITRSSIADSAWQQLSHSIPVRLGGLGLRDALLVAFAASVGSCNST